MAYGRRFVPVPAGVVPAPAPAPDVVLDESAYVTELKRFSTLLETMPLQDAIAKIQKELGRDDWWSVGIIEGAQDDWSEWFDNILGVDVEWDETVAANKWIWGMWFVNEIARREAIIKGSAMSESSDSITKMLADLKTFRALLDKMTLAQAITTFEALKKVSGWWSTHIRDLAAAKWQELFERMGVDTEDPAFNPEDEKHLWIWKKFFNDAIKDMLELGAPPKVITPEAVDKLEKKIEDDQAALEKWRIEYEAELAIEIKRIKEDLETRIPTPGPEPAAEPIADVWPKDIREGLGFPEGTAGTTLSSAISHFSGVREYVRHHGEYQQDVLFNMCWCLEMIRVCLNELKAAKAPGTQTDNFKNNLKGLADGTFELETKGVFHD